MCDNVLAYLPYAYSVFTTQELSANPLYDPDANKPWWELAWNAVCDWFASVVQWFNNLDIGWKIGIGLALFALAIILTIVTYGGTSSLIPALINLSIGFIVGVVSAVAVAAISMAINGNFSAEGLLNAFADGIFWGGVFAFVSASANAIKVAVRNIRSKAMLAKRTAEYLDNLKATMSPEEFNRVKFITGVYDPVTNQMKFAFNSEIILSDSMLNSAIRGLGLRTSCSEVLAVNKALNSGAILRNLRLYTLNAQNGAIAYACRTCTKNLAPRVAAIFTGLFTY